MHGLVLPSADAAWLEASGVTVHRGDVRDPLALTAAMRGADVVVHLAAAIGTRRPLSEYYAVNVTGTENVCRAVLEAGVTRLVHVSSTSVYEQGSGEPVYEDAPLAPLPDPYPLTKAAADKLVQGMIAEAHLPACIVRTCTFFGPGDHLNFGRIADRLLARRGVIIGSGRNSVPFTYVANVVQGLLLAIEHPRAEGQVYNIADDSSPTQEQLLCEIANQIGARAPWIHVPYSALCGAAYVAEGVAAITRSSSPLVTRFGVALYGADNRYATGKARKQLGYEPQISLRDGIRLAAAWYLRDAAARKGPASTEATMPRHGSEGAVR